MITANNITDAEIRELRARAKTSGLTVAPHYGANFGSGGVLSARKRLRARARCAEILNARRSK